MKKGFAIILFLLFIFSSGCIKKEKSIHSKTIVVSSFPIYSAIKEIAGEDFVVILLQPPYTNAHFFEPKPSDLETLKTADVFVYTTSNFDVWAIRALSLLSLEKKEVLIIDANDIVEKEKNNISDPHFWLSIKRYKKFANKFAKELADFYPHLKEKILQNNQEFINKLDLLDKEYSQLQFCRKKSFFTTHMSFGYLESDYNLEQIPIIKSFEPSSSEVSLRYFLELVKEAKEKNISFVFFEEGYPKKLSQVFSKEINASVLYLNTLEYYTPEDLKEKNSYILKMKQNLENLKKGLECG